MKNRVETFLEDMTYHSKIEFVEGKTDEMIEIAKRRGVTLPAHDLAPFKCVYAFVDRMNRNDCVLPRAEVEKALHTLAGKAIDFDHFRRNVVGYWLDAEIEGDKIIAWGLFFKGNFNEDYTVCKELLEKEVLAISFEAWGDRRFNDDGSYDLIDIEFAGGALLLKEEPAFPGSEVIEMAKKERVLEFAKIMTKPEEFVHNPKTGKKRTKEDGRLYPWDMEQIMNTLSEVENLDGQSKGMFDLIHLDFQKSQIKVRDLTTDGEMLIDLTPKVTVTKKGKSQGIAKIQDLTGIETIEDMDKYIEEFDGSDESLEILIENSTEGPKISHTERQDLTDEDFAVVKNVKTEKGNKKIRIFPIHNSAHIVSAIHKLEQSQVISTLDTLGVDKDNVERKICRRALKIAMNDLIEKLEKSSVEEVMQEIAKQHIGRELNEAELEKAYNIVEYKKSESDANDTSLLKIPTKKSDANETSLINASLDEEAIKKIIDEISKVELTDEEKAELAKADEEKAKAEEAKLAEDKAKADAEAKAIEDAKTDEEKADEVAKLKEDLAIANAKLVEFAKAETEAKAKGRRDELGEIAKDMKDEDLLDDHKYELAKKDKVIADLQAGKTVKKIDLVKGSDDKEVGSVEKTKRDKVNEYAFGRQAKEKTEDE